MATCLSDVGFIEKHDKSVKNKSPKSEAENYVRASSAADTTSIWLFTRLWFACNGWDEKCSSSFSMPIRLSIPGMILFDDGEPRFWLHTLDGSLTTKGFASQSREQDNSTHECMRDVVNTMHCFWDEINEGFQTSRSPSCVVWYVDGKREDVRLRHLQTLCSNTLWRRQVAALQGYVVHQRVERGIYARSEDAIFPFGRSTQDQAVNFGVNMLTKAIAKYLVVTHDVQDFLHDTSSCVQTATSEPSQHHTHALVMESMEIAYSVDSRGVLWLSHVEDVQLQTPSEGNGTTICTNSNQSDVLSTAHRVASELEKLLQRAVDEGVSVRQCFSHFDCSGSGYVDSWMLKHGLEKLGIGVSKEVANAFVRILVGGPATFFGICDLASFCARRGILDTTMCPVSLSSRLLTEGHTQRVGLLPEQDRARVRKCPSLLKPNMQREDYLGSEEISHRQPLAVAEEDHSLSFTVEAIPTRNGMITSGFTSKYDGETRFNGKIVTPPPHWYALPEWTRASTRRAVCELMKRYTRFKGNSSVDNDVVSPSTKVMEALESRTRESTQNSTCRAPTGETCASGSSLSARDQTRSHDLPVDMVMDKQLYPKPRYAHERGGIRTELKLHVGGGNIMSYRWVARSGSKPTHQDNMYGIGKDMRRSWEPIVLDAGYREEFIIVALPDLFMTLDSMERWLGGILEGNPRGRLLLVGSLGLPGTHWREGGVLDADAHAQGLGVLLWELYEQGELCTGPRPCVVLLGFGCGANAVMHFANKELLSIKMSPLRRAIKVLTLVNPFPLTASNSSENRRIRRSLQRLKRVLERSDHHEQLQAITDVFLSPEYISKFGRRNTLQQFWSDRQEIQFPEVSRPMSAAIRYREQGDQAKRHGESNRIASYIENRRGVTECLDGVINGVTLGPVGDKMDYPLILISSAHDALDSSETTKHFFSSMGAQEVKSMFELVNGHKPRRVFACSIQAGREILQEATAQILEILTNAIRATRAELGISTVNRQQQHGRDQTLPTRHGDEKAASMGGLRAHALNTHVKSSTVDNRIRNMEELLRDIHMESLIVHEHKAPNLVLEHSIERVDVLRSGSHTRFKSELKNEIKRSREPDARKRHAVQRPNGSELKKYWGAARAKDETGVLMEVVSQRQELEAMHDEDGRSRAAARDLRASEAWKMHIKAAKERALELSAARDANEQKAGDDGIASERAAKHLQRVELLRQRKLHIISWEEPEMGTTDGPIIKQKENNETRVTYDMMVENLLALQGAFVKAVRMESFRREQFVNIRIQYEKANALFRTTEKLQRTYAKRGAVGHALDDMTTQELKEMDNALGKQQVQISDLQSVLKERREVWNMTVSHVQRLKIAVHRKKTEMRYSMNEIRQNMANLGKRVERLRVRNEKMVALRDGFKNKAETAKTRIYVLERELSFVKAHRQEFFDTDVWHPGVIQRVRTAKLAFHLQEEMEAARAMVQDHTQQVDRISQKLDISVEASKNLDKLGQDLYLMLQDMEKRMGEALSNAWGQDIRRQWDTPETTPAKTLLMCQQGTLTEQIRQKPSHHRSIKEKQWVALDMLVNKAAYDSLSLVECEELHLDDKYKTELNAENVARILQLPHEIQQCMSYLKSPAEVHAHGLLNAYTYGRGDVYFSEKDKQSQDTLYSIKHDADKLANYAGDEEMVSEQLLRTSRISIHSPPSDDEKALAGMEPLVTTQARQATTTPASMWEDSDRTCYGDNETPPKEYISTHLPSSAEQTGVVLPLSITLSKAYKNTSPTPECEQFDLHGQRDKPEPKIHPGADHGPIRSIESTRRRDPDVCAVLQPMGKRLHLFDSMSDIDMRGVRGDGDVEMAIRIGDHEVYSSRDGILRPFETRTHKFTISSMGSTLFADLKVTILYMGCMDARGFRQGKLSSTLLRTSAGEGQRMFTPQRVGYASHARQKLNEGDPFHQTPGTIFIHHRPRCIPLVCGSFELVVSAGSLTEYSVNVTAGQYELCTNLINTWFSEAKAIKARLGQLNCTLRGTWESLRLREKQYNICSTLINEVQSEYDRYQENVDDLVEDLRQNEMEFGSDERGQEHDNSNAGPRAHSESSESPSSTTPNTLQMDSTSNSTNSDSSKLPESKRAKTWDQFAALELQTMYWGRLLVIRCQERARAKKSINQLMELRRDYSAEKTTLSEKLRRLLAKLSAIVGTVKGPDTATEQMGELSTNLGTRDGAQGSLALEASEKPTAPLISPAKTNRRDFERGDWTSLTIEEQQWVTMDQALHRENYPDMWQQSEQEKSTMKRHASLAIERYRFYRDEPPRVPAESCENLNHEEVHMRKLRTKFHDDPKFPRRVNLQTTTNHHDYMMTQCISSKDSSNRTVDERQWISRDRILNPHVWKWSNGDTRGTQNDQRSFRTDGAALLEEGQVKTWKVGDNKCMDGIRMSKATSSLPVDVDDRLRAFQLEMDRASRTSNTMVNSCALHITPQQHPVNDLLLELDFELDSILREQVQLFERRSVHLIESWNSSREEQVEHVDEMNTDRMRRRLHHHARGGDMNVFAARKRVLLNANKASLQEEHAKRVISLGPGGCSACMSNPCRHKPIVNVKDTHLRIETVSDELHFVKMHKGAVVESVVPLSARTGGNIMFRRSELIEELSSELKRLRCMLKLHQIDDELHHANRTTREYTECTALHGYQTLLWSHDAKIALAREHNRLVARIVAIDIIDDVLAWMLEGWYFGERQSNDGAVGFGPSLKMDEMMIATIDLQVQNNSSTEETSRIQEKEENRAAAFTLPPGIETSNWSRSLERVIKKGDEHDAEINFAERTAQFGLFCIAIMYFRAQWLFEQQRQRSKLVGVKWKMDILELSGNLAVSGTQPGCQRVKVREEKQQQEVLTNFAGFLAIEWRELHSVQIIQRVYRGYMGRKAAQRWNVKRAEYYTTNTLMISAAVTMQRMVRGIQGRVRAKIIRAGIAKWLIHFLEGQSNKFEAEFLRNRLVALKREVGKFAENVDLHDSNTSVTT